MTGPLRRFAGLTALLPLALPLALSLAGCASTTSLTNMWAEPNYNRGPLRQVLVVALRKDPARRRMWEDGFVSGLARYGVTATPSYRLFETAPPDTAQAIEAVRARGYDGLLLTKTLPRSTESTPVPGYVTTQPVTVLSPWTGIYYTAYEEVVRPGYIETDTLYNFRTDVWDTRDGGHLVWTGTASSLESSTHDLVKDVAGKMIVKELAARGIIPRSG